MARFPKAPGAGAKAISNPVYWSRMHLQNERYRAKSRQTVDKLNERWARLTAINNNIAKEFFDESCDYPLSQNEVDKVLSLIYKKNDIHQYIDNNIELTNNGDLSKYATAIKNFALTTIKQCIKHGVVAGLISVRYDAKRKMILINEEDCYFLG